MLPRLCRGRGLRSPTVRTLLRAQTSAQQRLLALAAPAAGTPPLCNCLHIPPPSASLPPSLAPAANTRLTTPPHCPWLLQTRSATTCSGRTLRSSTAIVSGRWRLEARHSRACCRTSAETSPEGFWVATDSCPAAEIEGSQHQDCTPTNVTWVIRWPSKAARDAGWDIVDNSPE